MIAPELEDKGWIQTEFIPGMSLCTHDRRVFLHRFAPIWKSPVTGRYFLYDAALNIVLGISKESEYEEVSTDSNLDSKWPVWVIDGR